MVDKTESEEEGLRLDQFLKLIQVAETGGQAKLLVQSGEILVNGDIEIRRRRKVRPGDVIEFNGESYPFDDFLTSE